MSHRITHPMSPCPLRLFTLVGTIFECPHVSLLTECFLPVRHLRLNTSFVIQLSCCPCPGYVALSYVPLTIKTNAALTCSEKVGQYFSCVDALVPMSLVSKTTHEGICRKCLNYRDKIPSASVHHLMSACDNV